MEIIKPELLEKLKKNGRIKDVSEAFKEFPVEEEWHKGDENIVKEYMKNLEKLF